MAKYTITIKTLLDNNFNFGLTDYPIFDENYRNILNQNILDYYYESEIGLETAALFKRLLNSRMKLIMPKYNKMYQVQNLFPLDNIFNNVNLTETLDKDTTASLDRDDSATSYQTTDKDTSLRIDRDDSGTISETNNNTQSGTGTQTGSSSANNKNLYQDTPHGSISMETLGSTNVYATNFTLDNNTQSSTVTDTTSSTNNTTLANMSTSSRDETQTGTEDSSIANSSNASRDESHRGTEDYVKTIIGSNGKKYSVEIYEKLYDNVLNKFENIDMLIIDELQDLFMGIF